MTLLEMVLDIRTYNFRIVKGSGVSGNLAASGAGKVLTFNHIPLGLSVGNFIRISGGTGTAELVDITAMGTVGTAGTVTVTTGQTHTGSWVVSSATAGIQEADVSINPTTGIAAIMIPNGDLTVYTASKIRNASMIFGLGRMSSQIVISSATGGAFDVVRDAGITWENFGIVYSGQQTSGGYGIRVNGNPLGYGHNFYSQYSNLHFSGLWDDILNQTGYAASHVGCRHDLFGHAGVVLNNAGSPGDMDAEGASFAGCIFSGVSTAVAGIFVISTGGITVTGGSFGGSQWAILQSGAASSGLTINGVDIENTQAGGISITAFARLAIAGCTISNYLSLTNWYGVSCVNCTGISISGTPFLSANGGSGNIGVYLDPSCVNAIISNNAFSGFFYSVQTSIGSVATVGPNAITNVFGAGREVALGPTTVATLITPVVYAALGAWADGSIMAVTDGRVTSSTDNTVQGGGTGCLAIRFAGVWRGFALQN